MAKRQAPSGPATRHPGVTAPSGSADQPPSLPRASSLEAYKLGAQGPRAQGPRAEGPGVLGPWKLEAQGPWVEGVATYNLHLETINTADSLTSGSLNNRMILDSRFSTLELWNSGTQESQIEVLRPTRLKPNMHDRCKI